MKWMSKEVWDMINNKGGAKVKGEMQCPVDHDTEIVRVEYWMLHSEVRRLARRDKRIYMDGTYMHENTSCKVVVDS